MRAACALALLLFASAGSACKKPSTAERSSKSSAPAPSVLTGSVTLAPGAELPSYDASEMERAVLQHVKGGTFPEVCTPPKLVDRTPVTFGPGGKLVGVMVAASEFAKVAPRGPRSFEITIKDCRLTPKLVVGQLGDLINLKNEVQFPFMPTYGANAYNETLTPGQSKAMRLDKAGVENVMCGFTAPCGRTDVVVLRHPVAAVTDEKGIFTIEDFPPDETVQVNAWHPLFKDASLSVRVAKGETKTVEFVLTPMPRPKPAEAAPAQEPAKDAPEPAKGATK